MHCRHTALSRILGSTLPGMMHAMQGRGGRSLVTSDLGQLRLPERRVTCDCCFGVPRDFCERNLQHVSGETPQITCDDVLGETPVITCDFCGFGINLFNTYLLLVFKPSTPSTFQGFCRVFFAFFGFDFSLSCFRGFRKTNSCSVSGFFHTHPVTPFRVSGFSTKYC